MPEQDPEPSPVEMESARAFARAWRERAEPLELMRLRDLRALTELGAARRFADLLQNSLPTPLRLSSGLVDQQRILSRLRRTTE